MAYTTLIMAVLMATVVSAGFSSSDHNKSPFGSKFPDFFEPKDFLGSKFTMPTLKPFVFNVPTMKPFVVDPPKMPDPETIKNYVPRNNEKYQGSYHSSKTHYSNVNGVENSGAEVTSMLNDNGKVAEEKLAFEKKPK